MDNPFVALPLAFILVWVCMIVVFKSFESDNIPVGVFGILSGVVGMFIAISLAMYAIT